MTDETALVREFFDYDGGDVVSQAYAVRPSGLVGRGPAVVLVHAWDGQNPSIRAAADGLAAEGYVVVAIDVYGKDNRGDELGDNSHLLNPLMADRGLLGRRLVAGVEAAANHASVDENRMAVMGYCFGGLCALDVARNGVPGVRVAISVHGALTPPPDRQTGPMHTRVLLLHGWEDPVAPPSDVLAIARELTERGADWELRAYGHAMHAFTFSRATSPERGFAYDARADRRSRRALLQCLEETLRAT